MKQYQTLKHNPIVKPAHYRYYFNESRTTAWRHMKDDLHELGKDKMTFLDFFALYMSFPDPKFTANWITVNYPKNVSFRFTMLQTVS